MIVPMKKVSVVVRDKERVSSLEKLREVGIVHLETRNVGSDGLTKLLDRKNKAETALGILRSYKLEKNAPIAPALPDNLVAAILDLVEERKALQEQNAFFGKERSRIEKWGDFNPRAFKALADAGISLVPYTLPPAVYASLTQEQKVIVLERNKNSVLVLALDTEIPGEIPFDLPEYSLSEIDKKAEEIQGKLFAIEKQLHGYAYQSGHIDNELKTLQEEIDFETARVGMETLERAAETSAAGPLSNYTVSWLTGYVPLDDLGVLKRVAVENSWALLSSDPGPDDMVPTKLKHNRLVSLLNPVTDFLEILPGYREADISGWFLLFFTIFFGMIFGDAGYGAIVFLGGLIGVLKTAKKGVPPIFKLLVLLGFSNFLWGVLTCSWFGVDVQYVPAILQQISLPMISGVTASSGPEGDGIVRQNMMIICFSLAVVQLSIGHIIALVRAKSLKVLGDIGSIGMLAGMYCVLLNLIASNEYRQIPFFGPAIYILAGGFVLNFVFISYDGSIGQSILESCKNIISMILGVANVFSDIMSYVRLWAVGLAGASISATVDSMAGPMLGHFIFFIFGVLLLVFGHGLNIVLNVLSVLVHGVRLNTLEFSGHVGLTWAGFAYKPFAKRIKKEARSV